MNRILIASDSFKGSASSQEIGKYIQEGICEYSQDYNIKVYSIADGGEGTLESIMARNVGEIINIEVNDPLGRKISAKYGLIDDGKTAIIEIAEASGLTLVDEHERNVMYSSTYGTGEIILDALKKKVKKIYIGVGGSATNDGGMGMAVALGVKFYDKFGNELEPNAKNLEFINKIDASNLPIEIENVEITILSDVSNPLCGENGASTIYGPQKGATVNDVRILDKNLRHYAGKIEQEFGINILNEPGAGAAGGLGAGIMVFLNGNLESGIGSVLELIHIEEDISKSDLVFTGEGKIDGQSLNGKAPIGIASLAKKYDVPVIAIVGSADYDISKVFNLGISGVFPICFKPMSLEYSQKNTHSLVKRAANHAIIFAENIK